MNEFYVNAIIQPKTQHWADNDNPDIYFRAYVVQATTEEQAMIEVDEVLQGEPDISYTIKTREGAQTTNRRRKQIAKNISLLL